LFGAPSGAVTCIQGLYAAKKLKNLCLDLKTVDINKEASYKILRGICLEVIIRAMRPEE
jgi:hypothetical protein